MIHLRLCDLPVKGMWMSEQNECTYEWRELAGLFQLSRIVFDFESCTILFENSLRPHGVSNLFFQMCVVCPFGDITELTKSQQEVYRSLQVITKHGNGNYLDCDVPRFDDFVAHFEAAACN